MENHSLDLERIAEDNKRFRGRILRLSMWSLGGKKISEGHELVAKGTITHLRLR
jgi:hypothetical protein